MTSMPATIQERIALPSAFAGRAPSTASALTATDVLGMLRRRMVMIIVLFCFFGALAGGGVAAWWFFYPGYLATCLIECVTNIPDTGLTFEQRQRLQQDEHERFVLSQATLLKSPNILNEALKLTAVRGTDWFKSVEADERLIELTDDLIAIPRRGTAYLEVAMECYKPKDAAVIVNEVVAEWYREVKRRTAESFASDLLEGSQDEMEKLDGEIDTKRKRLRAIEERLPAGAHLNPQNNGTAQQLVQLNIAVEGLELDSSMLRQYKAIYENPAGVAVTAEERQLVEFDPEISALQQQLFLLTQRRAADEKIFGPNHNELRELAAQVEVTEQRLDATRLRKLAEVKAERRQQVSTAYSATQQASLSAQERRAKVESDLTDQGLLISDHQSLTKDIDNLLEYRLKLFEFIKNLQRVRDRQMAVNVNIAQPAIDPLERHSPDLRLMVPFSVVISLVLSVGIALAVELLDKSVRTAQDVVRHLDVPVLGAVPDIDDEEIAIEHVETALRDAPRSMIAEAFRRIRTSLQFSSPAAQQRTVLVTSSSPSDGRTSVACNLAIALAQGGRRVLLVDANFRRPGLQRVFNNVRPQGLSNILIGSASIADCAAATNVAKLDVIGSGPIPPNPAELLGSEPCRAFLLDAKNKYDQIILDGAPVLLASDAVVLATAVDGCVLVVRAKENSRGAARRAVAMLSGVGAHLFGAVLNAAQVTRGGYFKEQLRTFYEYQADTAETQRT